ncbi:MAG: vitamin K epoxide reductase family protein [bacterium]|nr:vitamin K epoxide reductase family protein [bacterium]
MSSFSTPAGVPAVSANAETLRNARSRISLRAIAFGFIACALIVTGYMSYAKLTAQPMQCTTGGVFNCSVLENSAWAQLTLTPTFAIPTAFLGFMTHIVLLTLFVLEDRIGLLRAWGKVMMFGITLFAFLYHCYLTFYVAILTMRALCPYCLIAHACMGALLVIASVRLYRSFQAIPDPAVSA